MIQFQDAYRWLNKDGVSSLTDATQDLAAQLTSAFSPFRRERVNQWIDQIIRISAFCSSDEEAAEAKVVCAVAAYRMNDLSRAAGFLQAAEALYSSFPHRAAVVKWMLGCVYWLRTDPGDGQKALSAWQDALAQFVELRDRNLWDMNPVGRWYAVRVEEMNQMLIAKARILGLRPQFLDLRDSTSTPPLGEPEDISWRAWTETVRPEAVASSIPGTGARPGPNTEPGEPPASRDALWSMRWRRFLAALRNRFQRLRGPRERQAAMRAHYAQKRAQAKTPLTPPAPAENSKYPLQISSNPPEIPQGGWLPEEGGADEERILTNLNEILDRFRIHLLTFPVRDTIPAGPPAGVGNDPHPLTYVELDRVIIDGRTYAVVPLKKNGTLIKLTNFLEAGKRLMVLKVKGDSMDNAGIRDGDYVLVLPKNEARDGDIVVAGPVGPSGAEATLKYYRYQGKEIWLVPDSSNPENQPIPFSETQEEMVISGVALAVFKPV